METVTTHTTRRAFLTQAAALSLTAAGLSLPKIGVAASLPAPKYTLSVNLELMFPGDMPYEQRLQIAVDAGAKAYSFWGHEGKPLEKMRRDVDVQSVV